MPVEGWAQGQVIKPTRQSQLSYKSAYGVLIPYQSDIQDTLSAEGRMPLILVHGIGAEEDHYFNWSRFLAFAEKNPEFNKRYKVYLFRYETSQSVPELSYTLQNTLRQFISELHGQKIRIMAYSEGGLLTRNALQDPVINASTEKVITVATPFHGSPLANPAWLRAQLKQESIFSPVRMTHKISYWVARKKYPSFEADFHWDNFDNAISEEEYSRTNGRGELKGYVTAYSDKLITYGSYFGADIDPQQQLPKELGVQTPIPKESTRWRNPFSKHFLFALIRKNISAMPLAYQPWRKKAPKQAPVPGPAPNEQIVIQGDQIASVKADVDSLAMAAIASPDTLTAAISVPAKAESKKDLPPLMAYNDGISPISSTLWLGRFTPEFKNIKNPAQRMWQALKKLKNSQNARLLPGLDHRDWMDGSTRMETNRLPDLLHPNEKPRTTFEWFLHDLLKEAPTTTVAEPEPASAQTAQSL
jgi:pimeloyl-ACP methyl ester carboxylesterase